MESKLILLAEDDANDAELTTRALDLEEDAQSLILLRDGVAVLDYLYRRGPYATREPGNPALVLLDLKMPRINGLDVLRQIKGDETLSLIPVVVLTSSAQHRDILEAYRLGANAYVVKPVEFERFAETLRLLSAFWAKVNIPPPHPE
ncbi:MAG TPA: response regulator [Candidatus Limnocylindrales bacterium]|nr:response regulator [Candidatus Limnocylindrales bacterium]